MLNNKLRTHLYIFVLLALPATAFAQQFQCNSTTLPEFYSMYGGSEQFTQHTNDAINTFISVEDAVAAGDYSTAKTLIDDLFATYPKGDNIWWNVFNAPNGANLGTPHAYYGIRMLEDIVNYQLNPADNPEVKTANLKVVLIGCSQGIQPSTDAERESGTGTFVTNQLDPSLLEDDYCLVEQSLDLFLKYITAITRGELTVNVEYIELPDLCLDARVSSTPPSVASADIGPVWDAIDQDVLNQSDWFWMLYPSHVPENPDFDDDAFITGGMGGDAKGGPAFIVDDKWLVRKPAHLGSGEYNDIERRIYLPQWLQHEFYHHLYRIYPEFSLEVNGHDWFNLAFWPDDFTGQFEPDFYAESLYKRMQSACVPLPQKLITRAVPEDLDFSTTFSVDELLGPYSLDNVGNLFHEGEIILENGNYFWRNRANVQWQVTPDLTTGLLETGDDSPYPGQDFRLERYRAPNGEFVLGNTGLAFQGDFYRKRFDMLRGIAPFEVALDAYVNECEGTLLDEGAIVKESGQFYWETGDNERWSLDLDAENEAFLLGTDSPFPDASFEFIITEEECGLFLLGFRFQNNYYWRPKRDAENPSPLLVNPVGNLEFPEDFTPQTIDVSSVFSDTGEAPFSLYASSSDPSRLSVTIDAGELSFSGGVAGNYDICLTAADDNGGTATHAFTVKVGDPVSSSNLLLSTLVVYPNPTDHLLYIRNAPSNFDLTIYNVNSTLQKSRSGLSSSTSIDVSDLPAGVYFLKITDPLNGAFSVEKIIRN